MTPIVKHHETTCVSYVMEETSVHGIITLDEAMSLDVEYMVDVTISTTISSTTTRIS